MNHSEPQFEAGIGECPKWLDSEAKTVWFATVAHLDAIGMLQQVDREAMACYCQSCSQVAKAERHIRKHGLVIQTDRGMKKNPCVAILKDSMAMVHKFGAEFGLTPASRTRIKAPEKPVENPFMKFLKDESA